MSASDPKRHPRCAAMKCSLPRVERKLHGYRKSVADDPERAFRNRRHSRS